MSMIVISKTIDEKFIIVEKNDRRPNVLLMKELCCRQHLIVHHNKTVPPSV